LDVQMPKLSFAQMMVMTKGQEARARVAKRLQDLFDNDFPSVRGRVNPLENGPPVGYPVQFRVSGPDPVRVRAIGDELAETMRKAPHVRHVNMDWAERNKTLRVDIDQDKARLLGITSRQVADALQGAVSGRTITQYREGDKAIDVVSRLPREERT